MAKWDEIWERKGNEQGNLDSLNGFEREFCRGEGGVQVIKAVRFYVSSCCLFMYSCWA